MPKRKPPKSTQGQPPQLSHDELREKLANHEWQDAIEQLKRAERKRQDAVSYADPERAERSAAETTDIVTSYVARHLPAGIATSTGGEKGVERIYGSAVERDANARMRLEWYASQVRQAREAGRPCTDDEILKLTDRPAHLSARTLRRLKNKNPAYLRELLDK